jgi:hypothetical protein
MLQSLCLLQLQNVSRRSVPSTRRWRLESTGGCGKEAALFFKEVVRASKAARGSWCPKDVVYGVARDVAIAVQRGNNAIVGSAFLMPRV